MKLCSTLEEKNIVPEKYTDQDTVEVKAFMILFIVEDFPLRAQEVLV